MSAYIVSLNLIDALATYAKQHVYGALDGMDPQTIGQTLLDENYRSVNFRYNEDNSEEENQSPKYLYHEYIGPMEAAQIIKACDCLEYQSCENDDFETTEAARIINVIRKAASGRVSGYERAEWGMPGNPGRGEKGPVLLSALARM